MIIRLLPVRVLLIVFAIIIISGVVPVLADHTNVNVSIPAETSVPGCEITNECFLPYEVSVHEGGTVTWSNDDSAAHTVTAGTPAEGISGEFDSSLLIAGTVFSHKFKTAGTYPYFCLVHPWMAGMINVYVNSDSQPGDDTMVIGSPPKGKTTVTGMSENGNIRAEIVASNPTANEEMSLEIKFRDSSGAIQKNSNYDIMVSQNGIQVLSVLSAHEHEGIGMHSTKPLTSSNNVEIKVTLLGFGLPDDKSNWKGPQGEILMFNIVPEFGTIAVMIMGIAIISVLLISARSKLTIPKF